MHFRLYIIIGFEHFGFRGVFYWSQLALPLSFNLSATQAANVFIIDSNASASQGGL